MIIGSYSSLLEQVDRYLDDVRLKPYLDGFVQNWEERFYRDQIGRASCRERV